MVAPGDGALIVASQGADVIHYRAGIEGGLSVQGFDTGSDRILLEGVTPEQVRIYDFTEHPNMPESRGATLIAFDDLLPGTPLHSLIYLPGASGLILGDEVLIA
ncbi:hypothetical protein [Falsiroseomonas sp. HW251]|uniref:hypothetical protein n=1 Tax=Falsiroseomonas sp. HW251 TaxID=3390998 RepID=UPI003D31D363